MKRFQYLVLLVVLGALCTATATAGVDTPGQFRARQLLKASELITPPTTPTFFAVGLGDFVAVGQPVVLHLVDLAVGESSKFYICRDPKGRAVCFNPLASGSWFVDQVPAQSAGDLVVYQFVKTDANDTVTDWGFAQTRVGFAPTHESVIGTKALVSVEPLVAEPCRSPPLGAYCPMYIQTEANFIRITASGVYPTGTILSILATAKDGSVGRSAVSIPSFEQDSYRVTYVTPRITYRLTPISITEFETSTRTFRTLVDVIPPVLPTGAGTADR